MILIKKKGWSISIFRINVCDAKLLLESGFVAFIYLSIDIYDLIQDLNIKRGKKINILWFNYYDSLYDFQIFWHKTDIQ